MLSRINFQLQQLSFLDEYIKVSQGVREEGSEGGNSTIA